MIALYFMLQAVFEDLKKHVQSMFEGEKVSAQDRGVLTESLVYARYIESLLCSCT